MQDLIAKILSRRRPIKIKNKTYWVTQNIPWELKLKAALIYEEVLDGCRFSGMLRREQVNGLVRRNGVNVEDLEELNKRANDLRVNLYKKFPDTFAQKSIRSELKFVKKEMANIYGQVATIDAYTAEAYAEKMSTFYVLRKSCKCPHSFNFINKLYFKLMEDSCSIEDIRKIARSDYWRSLWVTKRGALFKYVPLTDEQMSLSTYSRMYENIGKHPEAPPDEIINDDDMLDGWLITQQREKNAKNPDYGSKINSSQEVFIMAKSQEHANEIYGMNTDEQRAIQNVRDRQLKNGPVKYHQFADQQRKLQHAAR